MRPRQNQGKLPQITFTSDFHELVQGDLVPGPCVLLYDPLRLVSGGVSAQARQINAFIRFHPSGGNWERPMIVPARAPLNLLADPAAQGFMVETTFNIPKGCDELETWFSYAQPNGQTRWDSEFGQNYWLRFPLHDIEIKQAKTQIAKAKDAGQDALLVEITSLAVVNRVDLRWRFANLNSYPRHETSLLCDQIKGERKFWKTPEKGISIPKDATVVFDVVYYIDGHKFTDDNQGRWYIAD